MTVAEVELFESGLLTVRDGTEIYWEVSGDPSGPPLVYLHGGPGSGLGTGRYRTPPTAAGWCVVGLDQRACGRSRPLATAPGFNLATLTTQRMIDDIEDLREHLGIEKWLVVGGSWGSTLALAYGEAHPDRVTGFVLVLVTTGSHAELQWISESVGRIFPREWAAFAAAAQARPGQRLLDAYVHRLTDADPRVRASAALAWCTWEDAHMSLAPRGGTNLVDRPPEFQQLFALQVSHSWANDCFLGEQGVFDELASVTHLPAIFIHGQMDISSPLVTAWQLHRRWPGSQLVVIDDEGHGGAKLSAALAQAYRDMAPAARLKHQ